MIKDEFCDICYPKYFVVYGFCRNCGRPCEFPLLEPPLFLYPEAFKDSWEIEKSLWRNGWRKWPFDEEYVEEENK